MAGETRHACTVGEIAASTRNSLVGGPFGSDLVSRDYVPQGVPVIRGTNMGHGRWVSGEFAFVSPEKADSLAANLASPGDLVFTQRGTLGQVALVPGAAATGVDRYLISQSQMKLTVDPKKAVALFLYYVFTSEEQQDYIRQNAIQTGVPHTNLGILRGTPLVLPLVDEQKRVASILGALDDKIELNQRTSVALEELARTLFKSWFVDFDPVRAKAEGRSPMGMDAETAALFPRRLVESELGDVPQGWRAAALAEWATTLSGGTPSKSDASLWGGELPWISPKVMTEIHADEADAFVTTAAVGNGTRLVPAGSTLVMVRGMGLHKGVRVSQARRDVTFNQDVKALVPKGIEPTLLLFALLDAQPTLLGRVQSSGHGTGVLPSDILLAHTICLPSPDVQKKLVRPLDALNDRIEAARAESRTLAELRDILLPKLISGELRVPTAEKMVEATL